MRTITIEEMNQVAGGDFKNGGGDKVAVLSHILSDFLNDTLNGNSILNDNNILNIVGNKVAVDVL